MVEFIEQLTMWQEMDSRIYWTVAYVTGYGQSSLLNSWLYDMRWIVEFIEQLTMWDSRVYWTVDYVAWDG